MKQLQARLGPAPGRPDMPTPDRAVAYPDQTAVYRYWRHVGITRAADDNDAAWAFQVAYEHPDHVVQRTIVHRIGVFFSEGHSGDALASLVTQPMREEAVKILQEWAKRPDTADRIVPLYNIGTGRLWRIPALEELYLAYTNDTDPQIAKAWSDSYPEYKDWKRRAQGGKR